MKLRQIEFVTAIARTGTFRQAAEVCGATQPSLSAALAQLEQELGGQLFLRTTRKVELTPFGEHMMPYLEAILAARAEAAAAADSFLRPAHQMIRIGISPLVDMRLVHMVTAAFQRQFPQTDIFFKECLLDDLSVRLDTGAIDVAILPAAIVPDHLDRCTFYADDLRYLPAHGVMEQAPGFLRIVDLPQDPIIMTGGGCGLNRMLEVLFAQEGLTVPRYPGQAISYPVIEDWSWMGLGAAILPQSKLTGARQRSLPLLRKSGAAAQCEFEWAWRRDVRDRDHISAFLDFARGKGQSLVSGRADLHAVHSDHG